MYKKLLLNLLFAGGFVSVFAQPTLTAANVSPAFADTFITVVCDTTGIVQGPSGASQTWNFSTLVPTTLTAPIDTGTVVLPSTTIGYSVIGGAGTSISTSTHAVLNPTTAVASYYIESASKLSMAGAYVSALDDAAYTDPMDILHFPFTYLNTFTDTYAGLVYFTPVSSGPSVLASESGTVTVTADAYGTLILPPYPPAVLPVTYTNVLRVHSSQPFRDSANLFATPVIETDTLDTYTWYQAGYHSALLTINFAHGAAINTKLVSYASKQIANHESVPTVNNIANSLKVYPNPAQDLLNIEFNNPANEQVRVSLCDMLGREVAIITDNYILGKQVTSYNTSSLPKGVYLVRLQSGTETVTRKVDIQ